MQITPVYSNPIPTVTHRPKGAGVRPAGMQPPVHGPRFGDGGIGILIFMASIIGIPGGLLGAVEYYDSAAVRCRRQLKQFIESAQSEQITPLNHPTVVEKEGVTLKRYDIKLGLAKYTVTETQELIQPKDNNMSMYGFYVKPAQILTSFKMEAFTDDTGAKQPGKPILKLTTQVTDKKLEKHLSYTDYSKNYETSKENKAIGLAEKLVRTLQQHAEGKKLDLLFQSSKEAMDKMSRIQ